MLRKTLATLAVAIFALGHAGVAHAAVGKPVNIEFTRVTPTDVPQNDASSVVSWDEVIDADNYLVEATLSGGDSVFGSVAVCSNGSCQSTLSGLTGGATYSVVVTANSTTQPSTSSDSFNHVPHSAPAAPSVSGATSSNDGITLSWSAPTLEEAGGVEITGYIVSDGGTITENVDAESTSVVISDVNQGQSYSFTVRALNRYGQSPVANFASVTAASAPAAPPAPTITRVESSIRVNWLAPSNTGSSELTAYRVELLRNGSLLGTAREVDSETLTTQFTDLSDGDYRARVRAVNAVGASSNSPLSNLITIGTSGGTAGGGGGGGGGGAVGSAPIAEVRPLVAGTNSESSTLSANTGQWDSEDYEFSFQWYSCEEKLTDPTQLQVLIDCDLIQGATEQTYEVTEADTDKHLLASVVASAGFYSTTSFSDTIAPGETIEGDLSSEETTEQPSSPAATETGFWTKRNGDNVKIYAKNIIGLGKVQFFMNGEEIAWIRAEDITDPKLRVITEGPMTGASYLVRDRDLEPGKNVFEIYVEGERVERRIASLR